MGIHSKTMADQPCPTHDGAHSGTVHGCAASGGAPKPSPAPDPGFPVPDIRSPSFPAEAHRQSLLIAGSPHEEEDQAFVDAISSCHGNEG
jgi:hypothetical protein